MQTLSATSTTTVIASWDTQQRLQYNPNAPKNPNKKPNSLSLSSTSQQSSGIVTSSATNIRTNQIVSDLLTRRSTSSIQGKFMMGFPFPLMGLRFSAGFFLSFFCFVDGCECWRIRVFAVFYLCGLFCGVGKW